jgi:hypothetical protein
MLRVSAHLQKIRRQTIRYKGELYLCYTLFSFQCFALRCQLLNHKICDV